VQSHDWVNSTADTGIKAVFVKDESHIQGKKIPAIWRGSSVAS